MVEVEGWPIKAVAARRHVGRGQSGALSNALTHQLPCVVGKAAGAPEQVVPDTCSDVAWVAEGWFKDSLMVFAGSTEGSSWFSCGSQVGFPRGSDTVPSVLLDGT